MADLTLKDGTVVMNVEASYAKSPSQKVPEYWRGHIEAAAPRTRGGRVCWCWESFIIGKEDTDHQGFCEALAEGIDAPVYPKPQAREIPQ